MAALYGSNEALAAVQEGCPNHYFLPRGKATYAWELGGVAHELAAGVVALPSYLSLLAGGPCTSQHIWVFALICVPCMFLLFWVEVRFILAVFPPRLCL